MSRREPTGSRGFDDEFARVVAVVEAPVDIDDLVEVEGLRHQRADLPATEQRRHLRESQALSAQKDPVQSLVALIQIIESSLWSKYCRDPTAIASGVQTACHIRPSHGVEDCVGTGSVGVVAARFDEVFADHRINRLGARGAYSHQHLACARAWRFHLLYSQLLRVAEFLQHGCSHRHSNLLFENVFTLLCGKRNAGRISKYVCIPAVA